MSTVICTGRRTDLPAVLFRQASELLNARKEEDLYVIVPNQLTLETERQLFEALKLKGSFRLSVMSPGRFCEKIFDDCGRPARTNVDEQGRAVLMGYLLRKNAQKLLWFKKSAARTGFENRLVQEITRFKQAGITPERLAQLSESAREESLRAKLSDLGLLYRAYEDHMSGLFMDGEDAISHALERMENSEELKKAAVLVYGFDITTASVDRLICGLCVCCAETRILMPLPGGDKRDRSIYIPMEDALYRLERLLKERRVAYVRQEAPEAPEKPGPVQRIARELYCAPVRTVEEVPEGFRVRILKNPLDECVYVAASIRELVRTRGWKYSDIAVITDASKEYSDMLQNAFRDYEVPYFTQETRTAAAQPMCAFLLETLALITGKSQNAADLLLTGFTDLTDEEKETLLSYLNRLSLKPGALLRPFTRGTEEMLAEAEQAREKLSRSVLALKQRLRTADDLKSQLTALYDYLLEMNCFEKSKAYRDRLIEMGETLLAADDIRVGNMLLGLFDQMLTLLPEERLSVSALYDLLKRGISVEIMKVLPQSPDSVSVCGAQRAGMKPVKAVFMMHAAAETGTDNGDILEDNELRTVSEQAERYLGPDCVALARTRRMYNKDALSLASEWICVTCPAGEMDGNAILPGTVIKEACRVCPALPKEEAEKIETEFKRLRMTAPNGALAYVTGSFSELKAEPAVVTALRYLNENGRLKVMRQAIRFSTDSDPIPQTMARALYGDRTSITRLERFAGCPFGHFVEKGLRPAADEPFVINPMNSGNFLHRCMQEYSGLPGLRELTEDEAVALMSGVADRVLEEELSHYVKDNAVAAAEAEQLRRIARRGASILWRQLKKGVFRPIAFEMNFGKDERQLIRLSDGGSVRLDGRIDRVDRGLCGDGEAYCFVVDYKSSEHGIDASRIYAGLQLQLLVYLAVACRKLEAKSAGVYYFTLADKPVETDSRDTEVIEAEREKKTRMTGIPVSDPEVLRCISDRPDRVVNASITNANTIKGSNAANQEEFQRLCDHVIRKCADLTREIYEGETSVSPIADKTADGCRFCDYASICMKDKLLGPRKRKLQKMKLPELLAKLAGQSQTD